MLFFVAIVLFAVSLAAVRGDEAAVAADGSVATPMLCPPPWTLGRKVLNASATLATADTFCAATAGQKAFPSETLFYVTPWNGRGYDWAKQFAGKIDWLAPVWLQLRPAEGGAAGGVVVTGQHDIDAGWVAAVRAACGAAQQQACPRIVPRVAWELRAPPSAALAAAVARAVSDVVQRNGFDGVVLEAPLADAFLPVVEALSAALKRPAAGQPARHLVLVLAPGAAPGSVARLAPLVDRFSAMTYDHGMHRGKPGGPNAPLPWVKDTVLALASGVPAAARAQLLRQVLVGLPFYGYDSTGAAVVGHEYLAILRERAPQLRLDKEAAEVRLTFEKAGAPGGRATLHYPTTYSLARRLNASVELGAAGVAVWEAGQGLPCFWDLF